jgi:ABC-type glycerol-3-phosphate transport system permease component
MADATIEMKGGYKLRRRIEMGIVYLALFLLCSIFILPFLITVSDSLKRFHEIYAVPRIWIPKDPQWNNFIDIFRVLPFHLFFINSCIITFFALTGKILSSCIVGYSFARLRWPGRDFLFLVLLSTMMLPQQVTMIPIFLLFNKLGWINTWLPLIVPMWFGVNVFNVFLLRQFFKTIPIDLEDAAKIDGCSYFRILTQIMIPLAKPAVVTLGVLGFVSLWKEFMGPLIYLSDYRLYPIAMGIWMFQTAQSAQPHYVMAASLVSLVPVLILFFSAQRYFVKGIVLSGMKG